MTVSVIVPVYKPDERMFEQALDSIHSQHYADRELIVVDDRKGEGAATARNRGLALATGEFVMFVDADDYLEPGAIGTLVTAIEGVDMAVGSFRKFGNFESVVSHPSETLTQKQVAEYAMSNLLNPRSHQMLSGGWAKLFRRKFVGNFPLLTTAEDMAFNFDYLLRCRNVRFIERLVYHNRKHEGTLTTTFDEKNKPGLFGFLEGLRYVERFLAPFYPEDALRSALDNSKVYHSMLYAQRIGPDALKKVFPC